MKVRSSFFRNCEATMLGWSHWEYEFTEEKTSTKPTSKRNDVYLRGERLKSSRVDFHRMQIYESQMLRASASQLASLSAVAEKYEHCSREKRSPPIRDRRTGSTAIDFLLILCLLVGKRLLSDQWEATRAPTCEIVRQSYRLRAILKINSGRDNREKLSRMFVPSINTEFFTAVWYREQLL